ncbi:glycine-rich protein DOT1-like [Helianthus annuus]|uniref:glycine-rich protein DOT1-like n=1 Tax=Helianthus annuus TaxID=4232 RepID=UPI000B90423D|nr:glycine-rich protein DOT1-like [Helianthus annuus]
MGSKLLVFAFVVFIFCTINIANSRNLSEDQKKTISEHGGSIGGTVGVGVIGGGSGGGEGIGGVRKRGGEAGGVVIDYEGEGEGGGGDPPGGEGGGAGGLFDDRGGGGD